MNTYTINELSAQWSSFGNQLGRARTPSCVVTGCTSMSFVALKTGDGTRTVCYRHFTALDDTGGPPKEARRAHH